VLESIATPVDLSDKDALVRAATTSLSSKVVSQYSGLLSPMAVDAVLRVMDPARPDMCACCLVDEGGLNELV
jgi:T-complex protein 1 subunit delta